jgi:hypothetical protein
MASSCIFLGPKITNAINKMNKTLGIPNLDVANFARRSDEWSGYDQPSQFASAAPRLGFSPATLSLRDKPIAEAR